MSGPERASRGPGHVLPSSARPAGQLASYAGLAPATRQSGARARSSPTWASRRSTPST
ncbi:transposase [Streptomyces achromogenes]|uniref:transposase n=1 Tax=Streptomyces achromogenes TaxID=67255 RepID=UPI0036FD5D95